MDKKVDRVRFVTTSSTLQEAVILMHAWMPSLFDSPAAIPVVLHFFQFVFGKVVDEFLVIVVAKGNPYGHVGIDLFGTATGRIDVTLFPRLYHTPNPSFQVLLIVVGLGSGPNVRNDLYGVSHIEPVACGTIPHEQPT